MPTYTYRCQSCGITFDKVQSFSDKPLTKCPECRKGAVRRVPQASAIVFKGSGWYATDNRSPSGQASKAADAKADKAEAKTDTAEKPKAKKEKEASPAPSASSASSD